LENTPAIFEVAENSNADGSEPILEWHNQSQVDEYDDLIVKEAKAQNVDPDLVRAIMYMETSHGYYPDIKTLRPMNVHATFWKDLGYSREDLKNPELNIRAGVTLLKRIGDRVKDPTIEKIATLYNSLAKEQVSDYGARVGKIYCEKLWQQSKNNS